MTDAIPVYTIERYVTDTDADFQRRQKLSSMFAMFQDIAALHAANLGAEVKWLYEKLNLAWILMRMRVEVIRYPALAEEVLVETWPQKPRALYERDYKIMDLRGDALVKAASTWVIMDLHTREIKRDKFLNFFNLALKEERALGKGVDRLKPQDGAELVYEKEIKFSDVDYNNHANNAKYVDFIMDVFSLEEHKKRDLKAIEVHYVNETKPGDVLIFRRKRMNVGTDYIDCVNKNDKTSVFNALVEWSA
jgi:acyl-ACP thioesterase